MARPATPTCWCSGSAASSSRSTRPMWPSRHRRSCRCWDRGRSGMHQVVQAIILGLLTGGVYALMASGQTLIFGIMKVINLAQAVLVIGAAYLSYTLFTGPGIDPFLSILITTPVLFGLGVAIQAIFLRPLRRT